MPSWSEERVPEPEWPLIMPCAARKSLIFSRNMVTLLFSFKTEEQYQTVASTGSVRMRTLSQSGRFCPNPRHWRRRRMQVSQRPSAFGRSSHF
jgi:hypothetical protein